MKKPKQTKRSTTEKAVENSVTPTPAPTVIEAVTPKPAEPSTVIDPERDEIVRDEHGENYLRKTPLGMLEEAEAEVNQRELADYRDTISLLRQKGFSFREIGEFLTKRGVFADHNAVYRIYAKFMTPEEMEEEERIEEEEREREIEQ